MTPDFHPIPPADPAHFSEFGTTHKREKGWTPNF
jgi:hypothetical protein